MLQAVGKGACNLMEWSDQHDDRAGSPIEEYDIAATPNDFNVMTLNSFVEAGVVNIPNFQRNYV